MTDRTEADREREGVELLDKALAAGPSLISSLATIAAGLAAIVTGDKVIALQHIERPIEDREDAGLGQWDTYVRVIEPDDGDDTAGEA